MGLLLDTHILLLAQCKIEGLRLATLDRALVDHPLAFQFD